DALFAVPALAPGPGLGGELVGLYRRAGFGLAGYAGILFASYPLAVFVASILGAIRALFHQIGSADDTFRALDVGWSFFFLCVTPPIFEELLFRGTLFGVLRRHFSLRDALVASAFPFAMIHLSVPLLITHVPRGLWFGSLRHRGRSLWPGMFAHFLHNGWVLLDLHVKVLPF